MHWLDTSTLLVVAGAALVGVAVGLLRPVLWVAALVLAGLAAQLAAPVLADVLGGPAHPGVFFGVAFLPALVAVAATFQLLGRRVRAALPDAAGAGLRWADRLAGAAAGAALAAAVSGITICVIDLVGDAQIRGRLDGSQALPLARARLAGHAKTIADDHKARLDEAAEWLKRTADTVKGQPAPAPEKK